MKDEKIELFDALKLQEQITDLKAERDRLLRILKDDFIPRSKIEKFIEKLLKLKQDDIKEQKWNSAINTCCNLLELELLSAEKDGKLQSDCSDNKISETGVNNLRKPRPSEIEREGDDE